MTANTPTNHHFLFGVNFLNDPTASAPLPRPNENSANITGIPISNTHTRYAIRKTEPPLSCTSFGNRHIVPKPTADPTVAAITPIFDENLFFPCILVKFVYKISHFVSNLQPNFHSFWSLHCRNGFATLLDGTKPREDFAPKR